MQTLFDALDLHGTGQLGIDQVYLLLADGTHANENEETAARDSGFVQASRVLSPRSQLLQQQEEMQGGGNNKNNNNNNPGRPTITSGPASIAAPVDVSDKWARRIQFLMKLYRMDVLNDKVLQKLSDRDLERSIQVGLPRCCCDTHTRIGIAMPRCDDTAFTQNTMPWLSQSHVFFPPPFYFWTRFGLVSVFVAWDTDIPCCCASLLLAWVLRLCCCCC